MDIVHAVCLSCKETDLNQLFLTLYLRAPSGEDCFIKVSLDGNVIGDEDLPTQYSNLKTIEDFKAAGFSVIELDLYPGIECLSCEDETNVIVTLADGTKLSDNTKIREHITQGMPVVSKDTSSQPISNPSPNSCCNSTCSNSSCQSSKAVQPNTSTINSKLKKFRIYKEVEAKTIDEALTIYGNDPLSGIMVDLIGVTDQKEITQADHTNLESLNPKSVVGLEIRGDDPALMKAGVVAQLEIMSENGAPQVSDIFKGAVIQIGLEDTPTCTITVTSIVKIVMSQQDNTYAFIYKEGEDEGILITGNPEVIQQASLTKIRQYPTLAKKAGEIGADVIITHK